MPSHYINVGDSEEFRIRDSHLNTYTPEHPLTVIVLGQEFGGNGHYTHLQFGLDKLREFNTMITNYLQEKEQDAYDQQYCLGKYANLREVQGGEAPPGESGSEGV